MLAYYTKKDVYLCKRGFCLYTNMNKIQKNAY